jgi:3-methyladenine DNA glycosylase AlkC
MENENAFKNLINESVAKQIATAISKAHPKFNSKNFMKLVPELKALELKDRVKLITKHLHANLPSDYLQSLKILVEVMKKSSLSGFSLWPFSEYISQHGVEHFDESMKAMYVLTEKFTAEFAVRAFLLKDHKKVLKYFEKWATDKNVHIRRWVSEGSRPLLPWGQKIPLFVMDPTHTLLLLDKLRLDDELYVRKSVANHLNDISKNHPQVVIEILRLWKKGANETDLIKLNWITRHALRTLIKKGHPGALKLMGVDGKADVKISELSLNKKKFKINDSLEFRFQIKSNSKSSQKVIVDFAIDLMKANGKKGKKVFKLKTIDLGAGEEVSITKKHSLKPITTMKFYKGEHHLYLQVNGHILKEISWLLVV